jgi:DNA-binding MarR family transcriptional regulator
MTDMNPFTVKLQAVSDTCLCLHTRMTARAVTRAYDAALAPLGLEATQFTLLAAIAGNPEKSITAMADRLALERSSLSRNLKLLERRGLIAPLAGGGRSACFSTTERGEALLADALPVWADVQRRSESAMGALTWSVTRETLRQLRRGLNKP